jgi:hypothetical protein
LASKTTPTSAPAEAATELASAPASASLARYRVLPKGAGLIYTGVYDANTGQPFTYVKGEVVDDVDPAIAGELEGRGLVEVLGPA